MKNNHFHLELFNNLNCSNLSFEDIRKLEYNERQLIRYFEEYNNCIGSEHQNFLSEKTKFDFDLKIFGGLNFNTLSTTLIQDGMSRTETIKDRKSTRLNSSHVKISYAVFCLKKKNNLHSLIDF